MSVKSNARGALQLGSHATAIFGTGAALAWTWGTWWALPAFVVHGALLNWLYCAQHELSHGTVFRPRWLNVWLGRAIGFLLLYPRDADRIQHFAHHRHTGCWDRDPELQRRPFDLPGYLLWLSGLSYWTGRVIRLGRTAAGRVGEPYVRAKDRGRLVAEARWHVALYGLILVGSLALQSWAAAIFWLGPLLLTKGAYMLQGTCEHLGRPHCGDTFENTRTARTGPLLRWLGWNMQYHTAHHLYPSVPFHRLPALHREIVAGAGAEPPTMGYLAFQRVVLAKLLRGRERVDYADGVAWVEADGGRRAAP